ncbi:MAG TPA: hypothetical protein VJ505_06505 [Holophagaceae bacterium]|nr:hypothetical protein [Holophagaceae bacterium]
MAVSPVRALLTAHFQSSLARSTKELSRQGVWALVLLVAVLGLFVALPAAFGLFMAGFSLGPKLGTAEGDSATLILGGVLGLVVAVGGVLGGLLGGAKKLSWEQYRIFPLHPLRLLGAELVAGLGDVLVAGLALGLGALTLGLGISRPALLPLLALVLVEHLLLILVLQLLLGSLAQRVAKRLKVAVWALMVLVWLGSMWMGQMAPRKGNLVNPALQQAMRAAMDHALAVLRTLPTTWAVEGLDAAARGQLAKGLWLQLYPLGLGLLCALGAAKLLEREQEALAPEAEKAGTKGQLWSFRTPAEGLGRLQFRTLMSSHHGKFGFLMPVVTVILVRGPMSQFQGQSFWAIPGAFAYLALFGNQFQFNQFGMDGHGVKGLFLLPLGGRQLLDGKLRGFVMYQGLQALLLIALMVPLFWPSPVELLAALAMAICFFLTQSAVGAFTSSWMPRRIDRASLKNNQMPMLLVLVAMGVSLLCTLIYGGAFALLKWLAPAFLLPGMGLLAGLVWLAHRAVKGEAAAYLERRREVIVEAVG